MDDDGRDSQRDRPVAPDGNRVWRVQTPAGPVLQKFYGERGGGLRPWLSEFATSLSRTKTGTLARSRRATEARLLALWREHGCEAPADLTATHPELANERTLVLEFLEGRKLSERLREPSLDGPARSSEVFC